MKPEIRRFVRVAMFISAAPLPALAAEAPSPGEEAMLEEVVVTAQKREESLADVPLSVEAVHGEKLQDAGLVRLDDLKSYVPNLQMTETGIANNIYIRGIGSGLNQGFEQSVSLYQDGVYHGRGHQARMPFLDLARVEVLRGPQPILFGKNAVAGAISLVANRPTREFESVARVSRELENQETTADAAISGPLTDSLRGRLAVFHRKSGGYLRNDTLQRDEPRHDDIGARLTLAGEAGDALTASLRLEMGNFDTDGRQVEIFGETPVAASGLPWTGATYSQALDSLTGGVIPGLRNNTLDGVRSGASGNYSDNRFREAALTLEYALPGGISLTSVSAFSKYKLDEGCDCDFVAAPLITAGIQEDYRQISQELRLASDAGQRLQWIGGAYFQKYELDESDYLHVPTDTEASGLPVPVGSLVPALVSQQPAALGAVAGALYQANHPACAGGPASANCQLAASGYIGSLFTNASNARDFSQDSTMFSLFGQGTFRFNGKWDGTLGVRVSHEKKEGRRHSWITSGICAADHAVPEVLPVAASAGCTSAALANGLFGNVLGIVQHDITGSRKETSISPLLNIQYRATDDSMAYASLSRGYKSGGFDARSNQPPPQGTFEFRDERATTFEVGIKTRSRGGRAQANLAVFVTDYKDLQTSAFDGRIGFNVGNGSAEVRGVEFEGRWRPVRPMVFSASMAMLDFEWTRYEGQCYFDLLVGTNGAGTAPGGNGNCDYAGRNNQLAPHFSGVLSAEHTAHLGALALTTTVDVVHSGSYLQSLNLDPTLRQDAYTKFNARIGLGDGAGHWQVAAVGRNLTDKTTVSYAADAPLAQALFRARSYYGFVDPPRSIALELRVRF